MLLLKIHTLLLKDRVKSKEKEFKMVKRINQMRCKEKMELKDVLQRKLAPYPRINLKLKGRAKTFR